jgi:hypothetical protein
MALACRVEEPSTVSFANVVIPHASQQFAFLFDHGVPFDEAPRAPTSERMDRAAREPGETTRCVSAADGEILVSMTLLPREARLRVCWLRGPHRQSRRAGLSAHSALLFNLLSRTKTQPPKDWNRRAPPWHAALRSELLSFPAGKYDDQVDALGLVGQFPAIWHLDAARGPSTPSFDHLVGPGQQCRGNCNSKRLGGLEVDGEREFGRLHHW